MSGREKYTSIRNLVRATSDLHYMLLVYGDTLAQEQGYKSHSGIDAIHFYLVEKYNWTPAVVKVLNYDDLNFLMTEKMNGWRMPSESIVD